MRKGNEERIRLEEDARREKNWKRWGPYLSERLFGLTNDEGNHGEDVKELYAYLDSTPTNSYMKALYRYLQARRPVHARQDRQMPVQRRGSAV